MSEFQPLAEGVVVGPAGAPHGGGPAAEEDGEKLGGRFQTFWTVVGRAFWRSRMSRVAVWWVGLTLVLTVLCPFVANPAPYTMVVDGKRMWPLFKDLTRVDLIWLIFAGGAIGYWIGHWRSGKNAADLNVIRKRRMKWGMIVAGVVLVTSLGVQIFRTDYLDARNYHEMAAAGELKEAVFAPLRWGYADQETLGANSTYQKPTREHLLGTDGNGRDAFARLIWGTRVVLEIGLVSEVISLVIGVIYGAFMGYFVGKVDILGMRFVEIVEAIPVLILLITCVALFGRELFLLMVIIGVTGWTGIARFVRAEFLRIRQMDYVAAAKGLGLPLRNILFRHMLPNGLTPVIVTFTFGVAGNIVSESILSFLGVGVEPPTASWGAMLDQAGDPGQIFRWWLAIAPGLMIFLTVFAYNIIGEGMRDAIDPRVNKIE